LARIKDVAKAANVSVTTVSNVINSKGYVSKEKYQRINQIMAELNYRPSLLARNLKSNKTRFIGVVLPDIYGHYGQMLEGIVKVLNDSSYHLIIKMTDDYPTKENTMIGDLIDLGVKGLLVVPSDIHVDETILTKIKVPYVLMERYFSDIDCSYVRFDNKKAVYDLTTQLIAECSQSLNSDTQLVLVAGPEELLSETDCINGFTTACMDINYEIVRVPHNEERAFGSLVEFLQHTQKKAVGFIVTNEIVDGCLNEALRMYGLNVKVYSLSGESWFSFSNTKDHILRSRAAIECGVEAAKILMNWIKSPAVYESVQLTIPFIPVKPETIYTEPAAAGEAIRILMVSSPATEAMKKLLPNFVNHFKVKVDIDECSYNELYKHLMNAKPSMNNDYDAYMIDFPWIQGVLEKDVLLNLDNLLQADNDRFLDNFIPCVRKQFIELSQHIYTIPIMTGCQMLFYRKDLFNNVEIRRDYYLQNGIELRPPITWSEYNIIAKYFTQTHNQSSPIKYGTCILGEMPTGIIEEFLPRQWSYNGRIVSRDGEFVINTPQNIKALDNLCEAYRYSIPESINYMEDEQIRDFIQGKVALISTFNSHILSLYNKEFTNFLPHIGFSAIPGHHSLIGGWVLGVNKRSHASELTYRFIKWASSDVIAIHNTLLGGLVPKNIVDTSAKLYKPYPWLENISGMMEAGKKREVIKDRQGRMIEQDIFEDELAQVLLQAVKGEINSREAFTTLSRRMMLITSH
jgi:multiple sugar transport system substrate-binding protein